MTERRLPFAEGADRLGLLFRLPFQEGHRQVLVVDDRTSCNGITFADSALDVVRAAAVDLPQVDASFDVLALPDCLTVPVAARDVAALHKLLDQAGHLLRPGGVVVGHCIHMSALRNWRRWLIPAGAVGNWRVGLRFGTAKRLANTLRQHGLVGAEVFYVEPGIEAPMVLIPSEPNAARAHFVRSVQRNRPLYSPLGYAVRLALAKTGWAGLLQSDLFFWAYKS